MTRLEALRSYTLDAAYAAFEERCKGSLVPGKLADVVVLSRDILTVPDDAIREARVLYTIVGGEVLHRAANGGASHDVTRLLAAAAVATLPARPRAARSTPPPASASSSLVSESDEIAMGRENDRDDRGLDGPLPGRRRCNGTSRKSASAWPRCPSGRTCPGPSAWSTTRSVNAFALPGGFIYVTRGILAHLNERGRAGRGSRPRDRPRDGAPQRLADQQGPARAARPRPGRRRSAAIPAASSAGLASQGVQLLFLKFSRDDERQADDLGLRYLVGAGYDPRPMPGVFEMLRRVGESSGNERIPGWLSTHPAPENRKARLESSLAALTQDFSGRPIGRAPYHARIDGIVFGDDPREGYFVEPNRFLHPGLVFQLDFPAGWKARNEKRRVSATSPERDAVVQLSLAAAATPAEALDAFLTQSGVRPTGAWLARVGDIAVTSREFAVTSDQGELTGIVAFFSYGQRVLGLLGYATATAWPSRRTTLSTALASFRRLVDKEALAVEPWRVGVVTPSASMSLPEFARRHGATVPVPTLARINQVLESDLLSAGTEYKIVKGGRRP